jgi:hypothetical protein
MLIKDSTASREHDRVDEVINRCGKNKRNKSHWISEVPPKPLTLHLKETLELFLYRLHGHYQNASHRKMKELEAVEKLSI